MDRNSEILLAIERMTASSSKYGYYDRGARGIGFVELILPMFRRDSLGNLLDLDNRTIPKGELSPDGIYPARTDPKNYVVFLGELGSIYVRESMIRKLGWDLLPDPCQLELFSNAD